MSTLGTGQTEKADGADDSISVPGKGYGNALMGGIAAARGKIHHHGRRGGSYDFEEIPQFVEKLVSEQSK